MTAAVITAVAATTAAYSTTITAVAERIKHHPAAEFKASQPLPFYGVFVNFLTCFKALEYRAQKL